MHICCIQRKTKILISDEEFACKIVAKLCCRTLNGLYTTIVSFNYALCRIYFKRNFKCIKMQLY